MSGILEITVVADTSQNHSFFKGRELLKPELPERLAAKTRVHPLSI